jgi:hypothetical protein
MFNLFWKKRGTFWNKYFFLKIVGTITTMFQPPQYGKLLTDLSIILWQEISSTLKANTKGIDKLVFISGGT